MKCTLFLLFLCVPSNGLKGWTDSDSFSTGLCRQGTTGSQDILELDEDYFSKLLFQNVLSSNTDDGCLARKTSASPNTTCVNPPVFCVASSCCLSNNQCGCWDEQKHRCKNINSYRVKINECSADGLRVYGDYEIGIVTGLGNHFNQSGNLWLDNICKGDKADAHIETNDDGQLGIRVSTRNCWNFSNSKGNLSTLVAYSVRIEDPDGWLMEKFLLRILQHVDIGSLISEFSIREMVGPKELDIILEHLSKLVEETKEPGHYVKWGCSPEQSTVSMDSGSLPVIVSNQHYNLAGNSSSLKTDWTLCTEDGMVVSNQVQNRFFTSDKECEDIEDDKASVLLAKEDDEWTLTVALSMCIYPKENGLGEPLQFSSKIKLAEGNVYRRLLKAARQYVLKRSVKADVVIKSND